MTTSVFVYGTLKPDLRYYFVAQQGGEFVKEEGFLEGFDLYHLEPENYPALVRGRGKVYGWLYTYTDIERALVYLDELEGLHLNPPEYERIEVEARPSGKKVWVYLFLNQERLTVDTAFKLEGGVWLPSDAATGHLPKGIA
ncbi:MAG: gamma-glutamylcyclotransferase [Trueperaceae bacterium]|nr:gamma-glutamylcyclotransferase [Trueperaceae bacterium]